MMQQPVIARSLVFAPLGRDEAMRVNVGRICALAALIGLGFAAWAGLLALIFWLF